MPDASRKSSLYQRKMAEWEAEDADLPSVHDLSAAELLADDERARAHVVRHGYLETFNNIRPRPLSSRRVHGGEKPARGHVRPCNRRRGAGRPGARRRCSSPTRGSPDGDAEPGEPAGRSDDDLVAPRRPRCASRSRGGT